MKRENEDCKNFAPPHDTLSACKSFSLVPPYSLGRSAFSTPASSPARFVLYERTVNLREVSAETMRRMAWNTQDIAKGTDTKNYE